MLRVALIWKSCPLKINRKSMFVSGPKFALKRLEEAHYPDLEDFCFRIQNTPSLLVCIQTLISLSGNKLCFCK